ncbi:MacB family efflux pump subunit [uncultured Mailhella sp.]|uniref:MacB family efflux pump subunit n=1 Tax=uncultured Mailhella sp. TaxID=1981031 RepID=UPI0025DA3205|nr:MacB family efflux pump subunit [uncultured Mailhella sp.]
MVTLEVKHIGKHYGEGENRVQVLRNVSLSIEKGDFVAIIGQSGSGKSTLMNILGCLDTPSEGSYFVDGIATDGLGPDDLARLRGEKFGFIFQRYNLLTSLSARENVALPAVYAGMGSTQRNTRAEELLHKLGLEGKTTNRPNELSGGQQQRVSIARAMMNGGEIILADEPTGALDSKSGENVMQLLMQLNAEGHTLILVTHDRHIAEYAHRIIEIKDGEVISDERRKPIHNTAGPEPAPVPTRSWQYVRDQLAEAFRMSVQAILTHKMRSLLTMLGIIIGIASVVSVVALGRGSQEKILEGINAMGTNTIDIMPGRSFGDRNSARYTTLTVDDADVLAEQSYIASATPSASTSGTFVYRNLTSTGSLSGVGEQYFSVKGLELARGRLINRADIDEARAVAVLDDNTVQELFPNGEDPIGEVILFNTRPFQVIGVTKKPNATFGPRSNLTVWTPYTAYMTRVSGKRTISSITVKIADGVSAQIAEKELTRLLTSRHRGVTDFFTMNTDSIRQTMESTTTTMRLLISCIAFISLLVGGIGVMNIMLVSVTERTKEIGVRMAIGARQFNVLQQFLIEAVLICVIGGVAGVLTSAGIGALFNSFIQDFPMSFSGSSIVLAITCSTLIGIIFGYMPARRASTLNPVDALAQE